MKILITILLGLLIIIGSILVITLNLLYKPIIKEFWDYLEEEYYENKERNDKNGNIK